jgi:hypothetical protein
MVLGDDENLQAGHTHSSRPPILFRDGLRQILLIIDVMSPTRLVYDTCDVIFGGSAGLYSNASMMTRAIRLTRGAKSTTIPLCRYACSWADSRGRRINQMHSIGCGRCYCDATADCCMGAECNSTSDTHTNDTINQSINQRSWLLYPHGACCVLRAHRHSRTAAGQVQNENIAAFFLVPNIYTSAWLMKSPTVIPIVTAIMALPISIPFPDAAIAPPPA